MITRRRNPFSLYPTPTGHPCDPVRHRCRRHRHARRARTPASPLAVVTRSHPIIYTRVCIFPPLPPIPRQGCHIVTSLYFSYTYIYIYIRLYSFYFLFYFRPPKDPAKVYRQPISKNVLNVWCVHIISGLRSDSEGHNGGLMSHLDCFEFVYYPLPTDINIFCRKKPQSIEKYTTGLVKTPNTFEMKPN